MIGLTILYFILIRLGHLAMVFVYLFDGTFGAFPVTTDLSTWYAGTTLLAALPLVAVAFYGFHLARAGRPVFARSWLEDEDLARPVPGSG